jgi:tRNA-2-methylthio-N6-dimethylallyladenosine synthase
MKSSENIRPKAQILTFGCQMNVHDSERIGGILEQSGFELLRTNEKPDLIVINTCSVREKPEAKLSSVLNDLKKIKKQNPNLIIIVAGCVAQQHKDALIKKFPFINLVMGPDKIDNLPGYLKQCRINKGSSKKSTIKDSLVDTEFLEDFSYQNTLMTEDAISKSQAYVTVMKGCNSYCSYCIVPYVRGRERSRPMSEIILDVQDLVSKGISSITLLGQNIARFGLDNGESFVSLLRSVGKVKGLKRLSFLSSHPKDFDPELIKCFEEIETLSPAFHLPIQHGSNKILKAMNRGYTREDYLKIIDKLKASNVWDKLCITTDVIIGFPGEEDADFKDLMHVLQEVRYDNSFSFIYSPRPGTLAYNKYGNTQDPVLRKVYTDRLNTYQDLQKIIANEKNQKLLGKELEILLEGPSIKKANAYTGRTNTGKVVNFEYQDKQGLEIGKYLMVKICNASPTHLKGELLNI